jgi:hypothetical protein
MLEPARCHIPLLATLPQTDPSAVGATRLLSIGDSGAPGFRFTEDRAVLRAAQESCSRPDQLDGGHHLEEIISAEAVGLCVEEKAIEARADGPHRIQERRTEGAAL